MPRKFRLSVHRKNEYRIKRALKETNNSACAVEIQHAKPVLQLPISIPQQCYFDAPVASLTQLKERVQNAKVLPPGWIEASDNSNGNILCYSKICQADSEYPYLERGIIIRADFSWHVQYAGQQVPYSDVFSCLPTYISSLSACNDALLLIDTLPLCCGNPDEMFAPLVEQRKGIFMNVDGSEQTAFYDDKRKTIFSKNCSIFTSTNRCEACCDHRKTLRGMLHREKSSKDSDRCDPNSHTNYRFLNTAEKHERMKRLHDQCRSLKQEVGRLQEKLDNALEQRGVSVDEDIHEDLKSIVEEKSPFVAETYPEHSFARIFWDSQRKALSLSNPKSMRWDPLMIRWCLYLRHFSRGAYEMLRESNVIKLPSQRTLQDYTHYTKACSGFSDEVDLQLMDAANILNCDEKDKYVILLMDEMHIKEDVVYDKHTGSIVGFTDLGDIESHLSAFEKSVEQGEAARTPLANSMLVVMVKGLFTQLEFPYCQFPCTALSGDQMYHPLWEAVGRLELCGFKVLGLTCDGLAANRRLFRLHDPSIKPSMFIHKVNNPYTDEDRPFLFFSDPPHLIKTVRNCWCGKDISWSHLVNLYYNNRSSSTVGLALLPKLKYEHIYLSSYSKMRVDLAAQVLSNSVAKALKLTKKDEVAETVKFVEMFDKLFDCLNVSSLSAGKRKKSAFKSPYRAVDDFRVKWMKEVFLKYLDDWEKQVKERPGFSKEQKNLMLISQETRLGLRITVHSFIELIEYIFKIPGVKVFLSNRLCQDPIEKFFGQQRQRGSSNDNPNAVQFMKSSQTIRVMNTTCSNIRGNCRGTTTEKETLAHQKWIADKENKPLHKRKNKRKRT